MALDHFPVLLHALSEDVGPIKVLAAQAISDLFTIFGTKPFDEAEVELEGVTSTYKEAAMKKIESVLQQAASSWRPWGFLECQVFAAVTEAVAKMAYAGRVAFQGSKLLALLFQAYFSPQHAIDVKLNSSEVSGLAAATALNSLSCRCR